MTDLNAYTDNELFALVTQDNEPAFNTLYHRYWKKMLHTAIQKLQTEADAEEIVRDAFIAIWNSRHRTQIKSHFHIYLFAIVRYKVFARMAADAKKIHKGVEDLEILTLADHSTEQWLSFNELYGRKSKLQSASYLKNASTSSA